MKETVVLLFLLFFSLSCTSPGQSGDSNDSQDGARQPTVAGRLPSLGDPPGDSSPPISTFERQFFNQLEGKYEGSLWDTPYEIWIERVDYSQNRHALAVLVFKQNNTSNVQNFLEGYKDIQTYSNSVCRYIEQQDVQSDDFSILPELVGTRGLWGERGMGGLGLFYIPAGLQITSTIELETSFPVRVPVDNEYNFRTIEITIKGEVKGITLFEPGDLKLHLARYFSDMEMEITKTSFLRTGLLAQYYRNTIKIREDFEKARLNSSPYCK